MPDPFSHRIREDRQRWTGAAWETRSFTEYQYSTRCHLDRITQDGPLTYTLDENGNRTEIGYPGCMKAAYSHDFADREASLTLELPSQADQSAVTASSYEPSGPLASLSLGNGLAETRGHTSRYFPSTIQLTGPGGSLLSWTYTTDHEGNILSIADTLTPASSRTFAYQDVHYFLATGNGSWGDLSWTYDKIGNRLTETRDGVTDVYSYSPNASTGNTAILQQIQLGIGGFKTYTYGPAGHLEQVNAGGNGIDLTSDAAGRLSRLERQAGDARADFRYDGRSFLSSSVGSTIQGLLADDFERGDFGCWDAIFGGPPGAMGGDCSTLITEPAYNSQGLLHSLEKVDGPDGFVGAKHVVYFASRPVAWVTEEGGGWAMETLTTDHLGTPVVLANAAGLMVWSGGFEPFGSDWSGAGDAGLGLRLPGQWSDGSWEGAGFGVEGHYNVYRWYQPADGRYARIDPVNLGSLENVGRGNDLPIGAVHAYFLAMLRAGNPRFEHAYGYAVQNPLLFADPLGLFGPAALATAGGACVAVDGPLPFGDFIGVPLLITAAVWAAGTIIVDWWANREPCKQCDSVDTCRRLLVLCMLNPNQPGWNKLDFGPKKDCGAASASARTTAVPGRSTSALCHEFRKRI